MSTAALALGYANTFGYDVGDGRTLLGVERDRVCVGSLLNLRLPYEDNSFDLVVSDQVFEHVQDQVRVSSCYRVMWKQIGWEYRFAEQQFFDSHPRPSMRMIGKRAGPRWFSIERSARGSCTCASPPEAIAAANHLTF